MSKAKEFYQNNIINGKEKLEEINTLLKNISIIRLAIVILAIFLGYFMYKKNNIVTMAILLAICFGVFVVVAFFHNKKIEEKRKLKIFIDINESGVKRLDGSWRDFKDNGTEYLNENHGFINDLDVFGKSSLFQLINSTNTKFGRKKLADMLSVNKLPTKDTVLKRQFAIKELSEKVKWRQELILQSTFKKKKNSDVKDLIDWSKSDVSISSALKTIPFICIGITMLSIFLVVAKIIPVTYLLLILMFNYLVVKTLTKPLNHIVELFHKHKSDIEAYSNILALIEKEEFKSPLLKELQSKVVNNENSCIKEMKALKELVDWLGDSSSNAYYLLINVTILSDTFILRNLEKWKEKNGVYLEEWLDIIGEFEALSSISNLAYDFDTWSYPAILNEGIVHGKNIGHPILGDKAIANNFSLSGRERVALITGSNMSGKSTFLRTIGLNLLLSYIGAPTYSSEFCCGIFNLYTCMRTKDNLEENISSFYAEILRIKILIEAAKSGEKVFFLLDEIFKGTNSTDRHKGAQVLINQLVEVGGYGLVSTHDLELCDLEKTKKWIVNYNFQEYYTNNKIMFDYKLRSGRSKTQNAIHLMKLAGIDFNE